VHRARDRFARKLRQTASQRLGFRILDADGQSFLPILNSIMIGRSMFLGSAPENIGRISPRNSAKLRTSPSATRFRPRTAPPPGAMTATRRFPIIPTNPIPTTTSRPSRPQNPQPGVRFRSARSYNQPEPTIRPRPSASTRIASPYRKRKRPVKSEPEASAPGPRAQARTHPRRAAPPC
jgi:hypothetical protein